MSEDQQETIIDKLNDFAKSLYEEYKSYSTKNQQLFDTHIYGFLIMYMKINLQELINDNFIIHCVVDDFVASSLKTAGEESDEAPQEYDFNIINEWHLIGYIFYLDDDNYDDFEEYNPPYELKFGWDILFSKILQGNIYDFDCYIFEKILRQYGFFKGKPKLANPPANPPANPLANPLANPPINSRKHRKTIRVRGRMSITPIYRRGKKVKTLKNKHIKK